MKHELNKEQTFLVHKSLSRANSSEFALRNEVAAEDRLRSATIACMDCMAAEDFRRGPNDRLCCCWLAPPPPPYVLRRCFSSAKKGCL
jgi:hypothetical protein